MIKFNFSNLLIFKIFFYYIPYNEIKKYLIIIILNKLKIKIYKSNYDFYLR